MQKISAPTALKIIIGILIAIIVGQTIYYNLALNAERRKADSCAPTDKDTPIPMRILINISEESSPVIGDEVFPTGEWKHVSEEWFQKNSEKLKEYPEIREARIILEEKLNEVIRENGLQSFAQGLKEAAERYHQNLPAIADTILKIKPYEVNKLNEN